MDRKQFAAGMAKATDYFAQRRHEAEEFWELGAKVLAKRMGSAWREYLLKHGVEEVEEDFIERYQQKVQTRRWSEADFLAWVQEEVEDDAPLVPWIKAR